jgi:hypothetical protein
LPWISTTLQVCRRPMMEAHPHALGALFALGKD